MTHGNRDEDDSAVEQDADHPAEGTPSDDEGGTSRTADGDGHGERSASDEAAHLADIADGCGCAEVWEHLSERRAADSD